MVSMKRLQARDLLIERRMISEGLLSVEQGKEQSKEKSGKWSKMRSQLVMTGCGGLTN